MALTQRQRGVARPILVSAGPAARQGFFPALALRRGKGVCFCDLHL